MRLSVHRLAIPFAVALSLGLLGSACSKTETGGTTPGGSAVPKADYSSLRGTINGSGSTFQAAFNEEVIGQLKDVASKLTVNYGGGGSGKGKTDLSNKVVDFAGTDSLVKPEEIGNFKGGSVLYFPTVAAPITVSYNLSGVDKLQLTPSTLAKIFQADIKTWDDAAIKADNPGVTLPSTAIVIAHRSDGSGTTNTFTKYLKAAAPEWKLDASDTVSNWPADSQGGKGNDGVAQIVKGTVGAIGYVDFADATAQKLSMAAIKNKGGKFVAPSLEGASAAVATAKIEDNLTYSALNTDGDAAYPITAATYIIVYQKQADATQGNAVKGFLQFTLTEGQASAKDAGYAALPESLKARAVTQLSQLQIG